MYNKRTANANQKTHNELLLQAFIQLQNNI